MCHTKVSHFKLPTTIHRSLQGRAIQLPRSALNCISPSWELPGLSLRCAHRRFCPSTDPRHDPLLVLVCLPLPDIERISVSLAEPYARGSRAEHGGIPSAERP